MQTTTRERLQPQTWGDVVRGCRDIVFTCLDDGDFQKGAITLEANLVTELGADETLDLLDLPFQLAQSFEIGRLQKRDVFPTLDDLAQFSGDDQWNDALTREQVNELQRRFPRTAAVQNLKPGSQCVSFYTFEHVCQVVAARLGI